MKTPSTVGFVVFAFIAGFVATIVFNQSAGFVLSKIGLAPPGFTAWALDPRPAVGSTDRRIEGILGRALGRSARACSALRARGSLLGELDTARGSAALACWYLHRTPTQGLADTGLRDALSLRRQCQRSLGLWNCAHPQARGRGETRIVSRGGVAVHTGYA